jgi:glycosyltransferase involved in cell wall biosynthesis
LLRIGINADEANVENPVGIGQFALNVIINLEKIDKENQYFLYLTSPKKNSLPESRSGWSYKYIWPKKLSTQFALPLNLLLNREKLDVFYTPTHYAPRFCPIPSVISIMDTSYLKFPDYFAKKDLIQLTNWTSYSARNAKKIVVISESTKRDVIKLYNKKEEDVRVCYPGFEKNLRIHESPNTRIQEIKEKYKINREYVIAIGTLQPRKNYERLIQAFANLKKSGIKEQLVIVGKKGWLYQPIYDLAIKLGMEKDVIFTGYVSDEEQDLLLINSRFYVLASLYEGFGIPILEAESLGVPCVLSNVSSIPEVAGNTALYFNPESVVDLEDKMREMLKNQNIREEFSLKGRENVKRFCWENCARQVLLTIESAV